jgi:hypothetical protein
LPQQLILFPLRVAPSGYVFDRQQEQGRVGVFLLEYLARVEQQGAPSDGRKLVLDLVALDGAMLRNDILEESAQRRNVPLPVVEVVEQLALGVLRIRSKRLVKGTARRDHAEIPVEHDEGILHGVDDRAGEGMPILDMAQLGHGEVFSKCRRTLP